MNKVLLAIVLMPIVGIFLLYGWFWYAYWWEDNLAASVQVGENCDEVAARLAAEQEMVAFYEPIEETRHRFEEDDFMAILDRGSKLLVIFPKDLRGSFFELVCSPVGEITHKFLPGI